MSFLTRFRDRLRRRLEKLRQRLNRWFDRNTPKV